MSVKASVSMSEDQHDFVQSLVTQGRFSSASAVIQHGVELLRKQTELEEAELSALKAFFADRQDGPFEDSLSARATTRQMIERKRVKHGL